MCVCGRWEGGEGGGREEAEALFCLSFGGPILLLALCFLLALFVVWHFLFWPYVFLGCSFFFCLALFCVGPLFLFCPVFVFWPCLLCWPVSFYRAVMSSHFSASPCVRPVFFALCFRPPRPFPFRFLCVSLVVAFFVSPCFFHVVFLFHFLCVLLFVLLCAFLFVFLFLSRSPFVFPCF